MTNQKKANDHITLRCVFDYPITNQKHEWFELFSTIVHLQFFDCFLMNSTLKGTIYHETKKVNFS